MIPVIVEDVEDRNLVCVIVPICSVRVDVTRTVEVGSGLEKVSIFQPIGGIYLLRS